MKTKMWKKIIIGVLAVPALLLAGLLNPITTAGADVTESTSGDHGKAFEGKGKGHRGGLASLSGVLGISEDDLRVALKSGESVNDVAERLGVGIDALVANAVAEMAAKADEHGKEFDADVAAVKIAERFKNGLPERNHGKAFEGKGKGHRGGLASLSGVLGISEDDLRVALKSGESVNDVAERLGVGIDALVANAVAEMAAKADEHGKEFDADVAAVKIAERFKNGLPERNHGKAFEGKGKGHRGGLASLSGVLGISEDDLRVALKSGESVNDVAERLGVGIDALVANAVAEMAAKADEHGKEFDADVAAVKIAERFKNGHPEGKEFAKGSKK